MLTAGKVYTALVGLLYLALATRALGVHNFGVLILIHAYAVAVRDFVTLKTSQCVVRYGAICLESNKEEDFQKLVKFTMLLDIGFCVAATLVGILAISAVGPSFGVAPELVPVASLYCIMILFNFKATPLGLLRLFDRFDLIALMLMVVPTIRLVGACVAYVFYRDVSAFLFFWFIAGAVQCLGIVWFGWREFRRQGYSKGMNLEFRHLARPHQGILSFIWTSHVHRTLYASTVHIATLVVGFLMGPVGAGLFKIAQEASSVLLKPALLFNETVYPEMAKIAVNRDYRRLWSVITHSALVAGAIAGLILLVVFRLRTIPVKPGLRRRVHQCLRCTHPAHDCSRHHDDLVCPGPGLVFDRPPRYIHECQDSHDHPAYIGYGPAVTGNRPGRRRHSRHRGQPHNGLAAAVLYQSSDQK